MFKLFEGPIVFKSDSFVFYSISHFYRKITVVNSNSVKLYLEFIRV